MNGIGQLNLLTLKVQESKDFEELPLLARPSSLEGILNEDMLLVQKSRDSSSGLLQLIVLSF